MFLMDKESSKYFPYFYVFERCTDILEDQELKCGVDFS